MSEWNIRSRSVLTPGIISDMYILVLQCHDIVGDVKNVYVGITLFFVFTKCQQGM